MEREIDEILDSLDEFLPDSSTINNERRSIAESLKPTVENVAREFVIGTMYNILFSDKLPNFKFDFREDEAIDFIESILKSYSDKYHFYKKKSQKILQIIKQKSDGNIEHLIKILTS